MAKHNSNANIIVDWGLKIIAGLLAFFAVNSFNRLNDSINDLNTSQKELSGRLSEVVTRIANQSATQDAIQTRLNTQEERVRFLEQRFMGGKWTR
jgi:predicted  nucleic acid-binding Zn-ribbon protein